MLSLSFAVTAKTTWRDLRAANYEFTFEQYVAEYKKEYSSDELDLRRSNFASALATIKAHNEGTKSTYKMGLSAHADRTPDEWKQLKGFNRKLSAALPRPIAFTSMVEDTLALNSSVDWRTKGVVTPTKDQGGCGSCWAFSATEVIESAVAIATGKLEVLAPQELVDCAPNPKECGGTGGCEGSTQWLGFNYTTTVGMVLETAYPYMAHDQKCKESVVKKPAVGIKGYERLPANDYAALMKAVATVGPIAVSVDASWGLYEEGVFDHGCGTTIDHAVTLVGYGTEGGADYWLVRNSWGKSWGEEGYIKIKRFGAAAEPCGIDTRPQDGTECKGGPSTEKVCGLCGILSDSSYPTGGFVY